MLAYFLIAALAVALVGLAFEVRRRSSSTRMRLETLEAIEEALRKKLEDRTW